MSDGDSRDETYMRRALELALRGRGWANPNPMVGAVVVKDGRIIGEGYHPKAGEPHAEVYALRQAAERARGATLYVTLEPCNHWGRTPPCTQAIREAGISRVVFAVWDANPLTARQSLAVLRDAGIEVISGLLAEEAYGLNEAFFHWVRTRTPFVAMKMAMAMDGKIATASGDSQWISGEASRQHVQELRATYSAVMVGIGTLLADDPRLTARIDGAHQPARIIVDSEARTPPTARLFESPAPVYLAVSAERPASSLEALEARGAIVLRLPRRRGDLDLQALMRELGQREITSILLEGGGRLNAGAIEQEIVQKLVFYVAPKLIGGSSSPTPLEGIGAQSMAEARALHHLSCHPSGDDVRLEAYTAARVLPGPAEDPPFTPPAQARGEE